MANKHRQRTLDKIHLLIRLELANPQYSSTQVAELCGLTINRFSVLKKSSLYQQIHNQYMTGLLTTFDTNIKNSYNLSKQTLEFAVPIAMQKLVEQALNAKDARVQNKALNDILDRDGRFAKVSRIGMTVDDKGGVAEEKDNKAVLEMLQALKQTTKPTPAQNGIPPLTDKIQ
jgi:hypothetical protein